MTLFLLLSVNNFSTAATLTYFTSDGSNTVDKPVLLVEGYDTNDFFSAQGYYDLLPPEFSFWLRQTGRDLVVMTFDDTKIDLKLLAVEFQNGLTALNNIKTGNHPTAVVGFSAGGLIARWGLKTMENQGVDHQVSVYISYDAPHRGATIPESIIGGIKDLKDNLPNFAESQGLKNYWDAVNSYSAKQILLGASYSAFLTELENLGYPNNLARFAVANGSDNGTSINLPNNAVVYDYRVELLQLFNEYQTLREEPHDPCAYPCDPVRNRRYDSAPGSTRSSFEDYWIEMEKADAKIWTPGFDLDVYYKNSALTDHAFVNTLSALDIKHYEITAPIDSSMEDYGPFDGYAHTGINKPHASIDFAFANGSDGKINQWLNNYHKVNASIPGRSHKKQSINLVPSLNSEWLIGGNNMLSWGAVTGATKYEILRKQGSTYSLIKTTTSLYTSITVGQTSQIAVRACNNDQCGYSEFATAYNRTNEQPF